MKKFIALLLCLTFVLGVFAACNKVEEQPDNTNDSHVNTDVPTDDEPTGDEPTGDEPTGDEPTGDEPTGDEPTGDEPTGDEPTGDEPTGDEPTGDEPTGDEPTGDEPTGDEPTGDEPAGNEPIGGGTISGGIIDDWFIDDWFTGGGITGGDNIGDGDDADDSTAGDAEKVVLNLAGVTPINYMLLGEDYLYTVGRDRVSKFMDQPKKSFLGVCKFFENAQYDLYAYNVMGNLLSATYVNGDEMMHIYWIGGELNELCVVNSTSSASALPPQTPAVTTGECDTIVTQMRALEKASTNINGMGYVVRLADGSFIIYDGGYEVRLEELWDTLTTLNGGEEGIVIRAWLLTHAHNDHYPCFIAFANKYASKVTLERLLISPTSVRDNKNVFNNGEIEKSLAKFTGAKLLYVHTGMVFNFCDVKMEILCTADEIYYDGVSNDFNNSSIVSRVYKEDGKSVMFLGDAGDDVSTRLIPMYGEYLKSDICQASHHGVEDFTIEAYRLIRSADWLYPCNTALYNLTNRDAEVRKEIREAEYTKNIYLHDAEIRPELSLNK